MKKARFPLGGVLVIDGSPGKMPDDEGGERFAVAVAALLGWAVPS